MKTFCWIYHFNYNWKLSILYTPDIKVGAILSTFKRSPNRLGFLLVQARQTLGGTITSHKSWVKFEYPKLNSQLNFLVINETMTGLNLTHDGAPIAKDRMACEFEFWGSSYFWSIGDHKINSIPQIPVTGTRYQELPLFVERMLLTLYIITIIIYNSSFHITSIIIIPYYIYHDY